MPDTYKVKSGKTGKTYEMPWAKKDVEPTDDEIDAYISTQESSIPFNRAVQESVESGKPITPFQMSESLLPDETIKNLGLTPVDLVKDRPLYKPEDLPSFPERFATEFGRGATELGKSAVREFASPGGIAAGLIGGGMTLFPQVRKTLATPIQNLFSKAAPAIEGTVDDLGRNVYSQVDDIVSVNQPAPLQNVIPPTPMETTIAQQASGRPFKDIRDVDLKGLVERGVKGAKEELAKRQNLLTGTDLTNSHLVQQTAASKPKYRVGSQGLQEVDLLNPTKENLDKAAKEGYSVVANNPDGTVKLSKSVKKTTDPKLPKNLAGAKPTFHFGNTSYNPVFESDLDKAAYIIGNPRTRSANDSGYLKFVMDSTGLTENEARAYGQKVRSRIKELTKNPEQGAGQLPVPRVGYDVPTLRDVPTLGQASPNSPILQNPGVVNASGTTPPPRIPPDTKVAGDLPKPEKEPDWFTKTGGALKSFGTGIDLSAPLRQARGFMDRPEYWQAIPKMFKFAASEEGYQKAMKAIADRPLFKATTDATGKRVKSVAEEGGLHLSDLGKSFNTREEAIMSNLPERLADFAPNSKWGAPIRQIGRAYRGSNRAYTGFLNQLRADSFETLYNNAVKSGSDPQTAAKEVAALVNNFTGRGSLKGVEVAGVQITPDIESAAPLLNAVFFSPRLISSRLNVLASPLLYSQSEKTVRNQAMRSWMTLAASQTAIASLAYMTGTDTALDPRSSDFGKLKIGDTRIDLGGGFNQIITFMSRLASGKLVSSKNGKVYDLDDPKFGGPSYSGVVGNFLKSKESPLIGLLSELWTGEDFVGQPIEAQEAIIKRVVPMFLTDMYEVMTEEKNPAAKYVAGLLGAFGAGVQTYENKPPKRAPGTVKAR